MNVSEEHHRQFADPGLLAALRSCNDDAARRFKKSAALEQLNDQLAATMDEANGDADKSTEDNQEGSNNGGSPGGGSMPDAASAAVALPDQVKGVCVTGLQDANDGIKTGPFRCERCLECDLARSQSRDEPPGTHQLGTR